MPRPYTIGDVVEVPTRHPGRSRTARATIARFGRIMVGVTPADPAEFADAPNDAGMVWRYHDELYEPEEETDG